ncbi:2-aminoethylphosphonate-pyruvate transaminase [Seinonella peptonophila]|uniref:2-aminoethylphosphonate--pyruvate transaminase n=1 Tax=Seinonella peptonophila TaxID=112248 RepID=A0A1M5BAQ4_9BACL|nr:2-aminoethylphosphonate--pyruvate transaminase [Seinonella peptonophila]SHF39505.1 2-aminoethylphosphonate-pyruvate transaminase [Seinonella peptonophila]
MKSIKRNILLNPGPATTTDRVKYAQVVPDICPREAEFSQLLINLTEDLTRIVANLHQYTTVMFGGSGTAAIEAMISSVISDDDQLLIIQNGAYGKRICEIAQTYQLPYLEYQSSPYDCLQLEKLETYIQKHPRKITHLAIVHNETTTGLLNDLASVGKLCATYQIDLLVDAMSSYAAIPIDMIQMNISYLAASSNKNIQGMPGVSFVIASKDKLGKIRNQPRNYYLNLIAQYDYFIKTHQFRFTPPVQTLYALKQALDELKQEGVETRYKRYTQSWKTLITGLKQLQLKTLVPERYQSKIVTAVQEPCSPNYHFHDLHDYLYEKGFTIYPGKLDHLHTFRISNIGAIYPQDIKQFLLHLSEYLEKIDYI